MSLASSRGGPGGSEGGRAPLALPPLIGHRGAAASAPENTLAGFRQAAAEGVTWVEFDVKLSAEGEPVLMHDDRVDRTTDGKGKVAETPLARLQGLDAGAWFGPAFRGERVPTLAEALALLAELKMGFNAEIKPCPGREAETAIAACRTIRERWPADLPTPVLTSFKVEATAAAAQAAPELPRGLLAGKLPADWLDQAAALDAKTIHLGERDLTPAVVTAVREAGYPLVVWTVNDPALARQWRALGVHSLITDAPAALAGAFL